MTTATAEKPAVKTGNVILDLQLPFMTEKQLEKLADYAKYLRWADAPLTEEEEEALRQGREDFKNGDYLTLDEFRESQKCGQ